VAKLTRAKSRQWNLPLPDGSVSHRVFLIFTEKIFFNVTQVRVILLRVYITCATKENTMSEHFSTLLAPCQRKYNFENSKSTQQFSYPSAQITTQPIKHKSQFHIN